MLFGVAFPAAPFIAVAQNFLEVRVDAFKLAKFAKRGTCRNVPDLGIFYDILEVLTFIGVLTNFGLVLESLHPYEWINFYDIFTVPVETLKKEGFTDKNA
jgi:hypothetical protein